MEFYQNWWEGDKVGTSSEWSHTLKINILTKTEVGRLMEETETIEHWKQPGV